MIEQVEKFNKEIIGLNRVPGTIRDKSEFDFLAGTIIEELTEWKEAREAGDFVAELDALSDLVYFALGGFVRMGIPSDVAIEIFTAVHAANMTKALGKKKNRIRQHDLDAVKPDSFVGPEESIMKILDKHFGKN